MPKRKEDKSGYIVDGVEYPSVTKVIGWVFNGGKSDRLVPWAVKVTCEYIVSSVERILDDAGGSTIDHHSLNNVLTDARKESVELTKEAGNIGEEVHELVSKYWVPRKMIDMDNGTNTRNEPLPPWIDGTVVGAYDAFREWADKVDLSPIASEEIVYNKRLGYAGTLDLIAYITIDGQRKLFILDIKTSNYFYDIPNGCQLSAYCLAVTKKQSGGEPVEGIGVIRLDKETGKPHFRDYTARQGGYEVTFKHMLAIWKMWRVKK